MANPFFDAAYYLAQSPDVATAGFTLATAEQHYDQYGAAELRAPNQWFNAAAYLAAYPDLVAAGVIAATAFQHYITYGINEGRSPSLNLNPAIFSYADYANANADLRTAFGISDTTHLTADQQHKLLGHFLSYGIHESRPGAESIDGTGFFAQFDTRPPVSGGPPAPVPPITIDGTHVNHIYNGTPGDDVFSATLQNLDGAIINGMAGNDTLKVTSGNMLATFTANDIEDMQFDGNFYTAALADNGSGPDSLTISGTPLSFNWTGPNPHILNIKASTALIFINPTDAGGTADRITVNVGANDANSLFFTSVEQIDLAMGDHALSIVSLRTLSPGATTGTVNLTGGASDFSLKLEVPTASSPGVTDAVVNGSLATGNQTVSVGFGSAVDYNVAITGGSGNDTLSALVDSSHKSTLNGGAGDDILIGSAGLDILTGGAGNDIFRFGPGTAAPINAATATVDTITDFNVGDTLQFGSTSATSPHYTVVSNNLASAISALAPIPGPNVAVLFSIADDTHYFMNTGDGVTPAAVIKIVLAAGLNWSNMVADTNGAHYVLPPI